MNQPVTLSDVYGSHFGVLAQMISKPTSAAFQDYKMPTKCSHYACYNDIVSTLLGFLGQSGIYGLV
jgi:hypothetical protein